MAKLEKCFITGLPVTWEQDAIYDSIYKIMINGNEHTFRINIELRDKIEADPLLKSLLCGIIANNLLPEYHYGFVDGKEHAKAESRYFLYAIENMYDDFGLPRNQIDRFDFTLRKLYEFFKSPAGSFSFYTFSSDLHLYFYCQTLNELDFFLQGFSEESYLRYEEVEDGNGFLQKVVSPTLKGFHYLAEKQTEVQKDLCFIAMSFSDSEKAIFTDAIEPAVKACGYQARKVDDSDHHIDKEQTINDAILVLAKKANFVVCDYTSNKRGVYFEHGYAWGLGKKVIMTVKESEMADLHFDVSHYPFIVWKDNEDLRTRLQAKIESWIGKFEN